MANLVNPPLGLYIHLPWCEQKCPYCDFNSYQADSFAEAEYVDALLSDLTLELPLIWGRSIETIFIGGGTPSLFSAAAIDRLFSGLRALFNFAPAIEVTLESNPGSAEADRYRAYREAGVNRLSIGVQSFDDDALRGLGRVHDAAQARRAVQLARDAGFDNLNLDLMYALPGQSLNQACTDLSSAIEFAPEHISHYQLTIEPNTLFHHQPPPDLPDDDHIWEQQQACQKLLADAGYRQYEVSAYCRGNRTSRHNLNYWHFGDYVGIGAGAHGKITLRGEGKIVRRIRQRQPQAYLRLQGNPDVYRQTELSEDDLVFEFMLNALRLRDGFSSRLFHEHTGLGLNCVLPGLEEAKMRGLIDWDGEKIVPTALGYRYLNDVQALFLPRKTRKRQPIFDSST